MTAPDEALPRDLGYARLGDLPPAPRNPKRHDLNAIKTSIRRFGFTSPVRVDERTGLLNAGHGRATALTEMQADGEPMPEGLVETDDGEWLVPVIRGWSSHDDDEAEAALVGDNETTILGGFDPAELSAMLRRFAERDEQLLRASGFTRERLDQILRDLQSPDPGTRVPAPTLADRFLVPPFDVLDARQGWWRERKRAWLGLGIRSELGRTRAKPGGAQAGQGRDAYLTTDGAPGPGAVNRRRESRPDALLLRSDSGRDSDYYWRKQAVETRIGRPLSTEEFQRDYYVAPEGNGGVSDSGTSVFDPVLTELAYRWYSPPEGDVLDPMAGGSVRGVVAGLLGRSYHGIDLSAEQVAANELQVEQLAPGRQVSYTVGDARQVLDGIPAGTYDTVICCPPYLGLERYSEDPADLSNMTVAAFREAWTEVLAGCYRALHAHSFAVVVVGLVRDGQRGQHDLRAMTLDAAAATGFRLHNAAVLITPIGSLAVRAPKQFSASRVLGRCYQDVLVLAKGDARKAAGRCGPVEVVTPEELQAAEES